jgi:hypothetical protein
VEEVGFRAGGGGYWENFCEGRLTLHAAREAIQHGWKDAYRRFVGTTREPIDEEEVVE